MTPIQNSSTYCIILLILTGLSGCKEPPPQVEKCQKYIHETYSETTDTDLKSEAIEYHKRLLKKFNEKSVKHLDHEAYHFQFYSSHGYGTSIKFKNSEDGYILSVKCILKKEWFEDCKEYQRTITQDEWEVLVKMIYEFDFWTEEDFRGNKQVLDGYGFLLEGVRPEAKECKKKYYKLLGRGSPDFDKMGALCEYILEYEARLAKIYDQTGYKPF